MTLKSHPGKALVVQQENERKFYAIGEEIELCYFVFHKSFGKRKKKKGGKLRTHGEVIRLSEDITKAIECDDKIFGEDSNIIAESSTCRGN